MPDRLQEIRARLYAATGSLHPMHGGTITCSPGMFTFIAHARGDIAWLLARLDSNAECGCPIVHVRMHTDECRSRNA